MFFNGHLKMYQQRAFLLTQYFSVGMIAIAIQLLGSYIWVSLLGFQEQYLLGVIIFYCIALCITFLLQKYWTFRDHSQQFIGRQAFWYTLISLGNLGLKILLLHIGQSMFESVGIDFFDGWYLLIQSFVLVLTALVSFLLNKRFTFRTSES
jgi:putative flippase GtrA